MNFRRLLVIICLCLAASMVSACGGNGENRAPGGNVVSTQTGKETVQPAQETPKTQPSATPTAQPQIVEQTNETLPDASFLSTWPGVLKCMSLTIEEILTVLGTNFELYANEAQGYDMYQFSEYDIVIEYDTISERISSIRVGDTFYYVYSGQIKSFDIDNDGVEEEIAAYEDENLNGRVTVFEKDGLVKAEQTTDYFDGRCEMSFVSGYGPSKESLIILDIRAERNCEVFAYMDGKLISMIPPNQEDMTEQAVVSTDGTAIQLSLPQKGISYNCPVPQCLLESYPEGEPLIHRFAVNARPVISESGLSLLIRHSLQVMYYESDAYEGGTQTYFDIAQLVNEYQYLGDGKWQFISLKSGPKYDSLDMHSCLDFSDFTVNGVNLLMPVEEAVSYIDIDMAKYSESDLMYGALIKINGVCYGITDNMVSYISLEKSSEIATRRGLKTGDTRQQALDLYGLPDKGYFEDSMWTYYYLREESEEEGGFSMADTLNIEFAGDRVSRIWMSVYISAY